MSGPQAAVLIAATMTTGLMAGVYGLYQHTIMQGLKNVDDRTFVGAFQALDRAIVNPVFMLAFLGAPGLTVLASAVAFGPWVLAALILNIAVTVITLTVNVPMNDALKAAGDPDSIADLAAVRRDFDERRWRRWNLVRTLATTVALGCLCGALVQLGQQG